MRCAFHVLTQPCPSLCGPMDCSLWCSSVHGIFQARILEWVRVRCHFLLQGIFPTPRSNSPLLHLLLWQANSLPLAPPGKPCALHRVVHLLPLINLHWCIITNQSPDPIRVHWTVYILWCLINLEWHISTVWRRKWQPTPFLENLHEQRSVVGYSPWGLKESDMTKWLPHTHTHIHHNVITQ